jgi:hypothetical protein
MVDEMGGACSAHGEMRNICKILVSKPEMKTPLGRTKHRWWHDIKMHFREVGCGLDSSG